MEGNVKISCEYCDAFLSVPREFSGLIACVKCRNEMTVTSPTWMPPRTQEISTTAIPDAHLIASRLRSIENAIRGISTTIWMVFFVIPMIFSLFWIVFFINLF
jgi:hypothetical protein